MPKQNHQSATRALIESSVQAASDIRKEIRSGWLWQILAYLERRREFKQRIRDRAVAFERCQKGYHESRNWRHWETTPIIAKAGDTVPLGKRAAWTACCMHCGKPISTFIKTYE